MTLTGVLYWMRNAWNEIKASAVKVIIWTVADSLIISVEASEQHNAWYLKNVNTFAYAQYNISSKTVTARMQNGYFMVHCQKHQPITHKRAEPTEKRCNEKKKKSLAKQLNFNILMFVVL